MAAMQLSGGGDYGGRRYALQADAIMLGSRQRRKGLVASSGERGDGRVGSLAVNPGADGQDWLPSVKSTIMISPCY